MNRKRTGVILLALGLVMIVAAFLIVILAGGKEEHAQPDQPGIDLTQSLPDSPPDLSVICGGTRIGALSGNYTWNLTIACGAHPLQCKDMVAERGAQCETSEATATLHFTDPDPDSLTVTCYPASAWDDTDAKGEAAAVSGSTLTLQPGEWIYVVDASWGDGMEQGGTAEYVFCVTREE